MRRTLAVVHAAAGEKTHELLAFVLGKVGIDVRGDKIGLVRHYDCGLQIAECGMPNDLEQKADIRNWNFGLNF